MMPTWKKVLSAQMVPAVVELASLEVKSAASASAPAGKYTAHATSAWRARMQRVEGLTCHVPPPCIAQ